MAQKSNGSEAARSHQAGDDVLLHLRNGSDYVRAELSPSEPVEFEVDNFRGRFLFLHRPCSSYDNKDTGEDYPYKEHFQGRRRLWEWRMQGRFKQTPGMLYCGIELEQYVPVTWATQATMRGILPLIQRAIQCNGLRHELGSAEDATLRPAVVGPLWAADNLLVHTDPADAPNIAATSLPTGLNRKGARQYWEALWEGRTEGWDSEDKSPTFTIAVWGPSQILDLRNWVFRKMPFTWGRELKMEPFCGRQPVHAVIYEVKKYDKQSKEHRQEYKSYVADLRMTPQAVWDTGTVGTKVPCYAETDADTDRPPWLPLASVTTLPDTFETDEPPRSRTVSFCSALSRNSSDASDDDDEAAEGEDNTSTSPRSTDGDSGAEQLLPDISAVTPPNPAPALTHTWGQSRRSLNLAADAPPSALSRNRRWLWRPMQLLLRCRRRCSSRRISQHVTYELDPSSESSPTRSLVTHDYTGHPSEMEEP